jgi:hypothetical protein
MHQVSNDLHADDLPNVQWSERRFIPSGSARAGGFAFDDESLIEQLDRIDVPVERLESPFKS